MANDAQNILEPLMGSLRPESSGYVAASRGARLFYELYAGTSGKTLVLINGAYGKIPFMGHVIQRMVRLGYRVLVHEPRGIGRSSCPPGPQTTKLLAADCLAVVNEVLGADSRFFVMGFSLGGMVAQELLHRLVVSRQQTRVHAAFLVVTTAGERWRPLPFRRAGNVRRTIIPHVLYRDQTEFDERFPRAAVPVIFSAEWLDAAAPPARSCQQQQPQRQQQPSQQQQQQPQPQQQPQEPQPQQEEKAAAPATRRDLILDLWSVHWRHMSALHEEETAAVVWHMTAQKSHHLGSRRAAAIKAAGIKVGMGISTGDAVYPESPQRLLAERLGAEQHVVGVGHCDCCFLVGVSWLAAGALATFGDSRV